MRAIDSNIVIRLCARDDKDQLDIALTTIESPFIILPTVILESVWVLQTIYKLDRVELASKLTELLGHENATSVSSDAVMWAIERFALGADFADMLHVALASEAEGSCFATFDRGIAKYVTDDEMIIETLA
jgi:predicted nucleic-acid-binding protein